MAHAGSLASFFKMLRETLTAYTFNLAALFAGFLIANQLGVFRMAPWTLALYPAVHPIVSAIFEKVEERLMKATVKDGSIIFGKRLSELDLAARMGIDIIAIRRNKDWIINPKETERVLVGDILITRGAPLGSKEFKEIAEGRTKQLEEQY
ncbi:MAG TPA: TrkA C-terminal domain-containing protein [Candidatus Bathyarchaeia archaeon]|nr:TrkA C-terminal domain-containing protein [Candidatus Bathyarchaeia archaeon]